jgi:hypothetical protein
MFYVHTLCFYYMFIIIVYFVFVTWGSKNLRKGAVSPAFPSFTVYLLTFNFIHFMATLPLQFWAVFTFGGSGPAITAYIRFIGH